MKSRTTFSIFALTALLALPGRVRAQGVVSEWPRELTTADLEVEIRYRSGGEDVVVRTTEPTRVLNELTRDALARGEELDSLEVRRPTLEQVYLDLLDEETTE